MRIEARGGRDRPRYYGSKSAFVNSNCVIPKKYNEDIVVILLLY